MLNTVADEAASLVVNSTGTRAAPAARGRRLTSPVPRFKMRVVSLPLRGSDAHDKDKNPMKGYGALSVAKLTDSNVHEKNLPRFRISGFRAFCADS